MPDPGPSSLPTGPAAAPARPPLPGPPTAPFRSAGTATGEAPPAPAGPEAAGTAAALAPVPPESALERILRGPSGLGTTALSLARRAEPAAPPAPPEPAAPTALPAPAAPPAPPVPTVPAAPVAAAVEAVLAAASAALDGETSAAQGTPVPGLYFHPIAEPDPARVAEVSRRIKEWAVDEVQAVPAEWEDQFDGFSVGRYMVACHPDAPTVDHLMAATRLMVAENAVDDVYCEDHGGSPIGLGSRLLLAHTALDPLHTTEEYAPAWRESLASDGPRRAYRSAMDYFCRLATPSQADRYRHDMARLHMGYLAEAAWAETDHVPEVWEYLAMRQFNNFRPCPTITDTVGGYELPADLHALPAMQRVIALAGNATTIVNDLYSYTKELDSPGTHLNLPVVIAEREGLSAKEAYLKAVEVHNDLMHAFEAEAAALAAGCPTPVVLRFLRGVAAWVDGNHYWHQTNTYRYSLPDFW
ncbi:family 2 encapsulin nanocompartment cargo protein terpene cyclase [Streptomyces roseicoloratus]|uniref:family 2 encapsulin nanocompartment cargo protein terpene cyclase n=1 Tax=Streptomyces roseicoloratus TaxID=2508722 RepID=UPI001009A29D|nr:family 2 encapsulin nanocompartment cargo protein terpene cyclase [Streptomyces roseicoloratus]